MASTTRNERQPLLRNINTNTVRTMSSTWPDGSPRWEANPQTPNPEAHRKPDDSIKRLIICCDGTWKSSDQGPPSIPSTITRFCRSLNCVSLSGNKEIQQIVYYQSGLGTGEQTALQTVAAGQLRSYNY